MISKVTTMFRARCAVIVAIALLSALPGRAASQILDWLELAPNPTTSSFELLDDALQSVAGGGLSISDGIAFPGPVARTLEGGFWASDPGFVDSLHGDASVRGFEFRVAPLGGVASYSLELALTPGVPYFLMIADMFRSPDDATSDVMLTALSDTGGFTISYLGATPWSNGIKPLDQPVAWNEGTRTLATVAGANGESSPAFFQIAAPSGANPRLVIDFEDAYALGSGDAILVGLAVVIPEPSSAILLLASAAWLCLSRKRR